MKILEESWSTKNSKAWSRSGGQDIAMKAPKGRDKEMAKKELRNISREVYRKKSNITKKDEVTENTIEIKAWEREGKRQDGPEQKD